MIEYLKPAQKKYFYKLLIDSHYPLVDQAVALTLMFFKDRTNLAGQDPVNFTGTVEVGQTLQPKVSQDLKMIFGFSEQQLSNTQFEEIYTTDSTFDETAHLADRVAVNIYCPYVDFGDTKIGDLYPIWLVQVSENGYLSLPDYLEYSKSKHLNSSKTIQI